MKQLQKEWLEAAPWETVLTVNQALCQAQQTEHKPSAEGDERARRVWQAAAAKRMTLAEALEICRQCCQFAPFAFNNGNTFAAIGKTLIEDWLKTLPPVEAQIIRTTVGHYVAGLVGKKELMTILSHFEDWSKASVRAAGVAAPAALPAAKATRAIPRAQPSA